MLGTWIQSLVWEDPTGHRATQPVHHNYWSPRAAMEATPGRSSCTTRKSSPCLPKLETARVQQRRPSVARKKVLIFKSYSILICSDNLDSEETRVLYWPGQTAALRETGQRAKPQSLEPSGLLPTLSTQHKWKGNLSSLHSFGTRVMSVQRVGPGWLLLTGAQAFPTQFVDRTYCCANIWRCQHCLPHMHSLLLPSSFTSCFSLASGLPCLTAAWTLGCKNEF